MRCRSALRCCSPRGRPGRLGGACCARRRRLCGQPADGAGECLCPAGGQGLEWGLIAVLVSRWMPSRQLCSTGHALTRNKPLRYRWGAAWLNYLASRQLLSLLCHRSFPTSPPSPQAALAGNYTGDEPQSAICFCPLPTPASHFALLPAPPPCRRPRWRATSPLMSCRPRATWR